MTADAAVFVSPRPLTLTEVGELRRRWHAFDPPSACPCRQCRKARHTGRPR